MAGGDVGGQGGVDEVGAAEAGIGGGARFEGGFDFGGGAEAVVFAAGLFAAGACAGAAVGVFVFFGFHIFLSIFVAVNPEGERAPPRRRRSLRPCGHPFFGLEDSDCHDVDLPFPNFKIDSEFDHLKFDFRG